MDAFFLNLVNMSITASWLVLAVIIFRLLLKKAPKAITVALWAIVALRLIFPFSIESVLSLVPSAETIPQEIVYAREPVINSGVESINRVVNPIITETFAPSTELTSINPIQIFLAFVELFWIIGMIVMVLYALISYIRLSLRVRESVKLRDNIYICDSIPSPFILGMFRPRIFLPSSMNESDMEYVIAHEKAHLRRRDHFWKPLGFALLTVYWFNPVLWVAYILLCRDIELACDERVIADMNADDKKAYSTALLNCSMPRRMISACPLAFGEVGVKQRIKSVLNYKKPAFWLIVAAIIITVAVAVGFLTNPKEEDYSDLPNITAHAYEVEQVVYTSPYLSFLYFPGHNTPFYTVTEGHDLLQKEADETGNNWKNIGKLKEAELSHYNFDVFIEDFHDSAWRNELSARKLRENNANAWVLESDTLFFLLQQKDGSVYTAFGTNMIHHVFKLVTNIHEDMGLIAVSGENSVPIKVLSTDDSLEKIKNEVNWLDISFNDDQFTPFDIYCDGATQLGLFSIYDANTFEPLDFFRPSGLSPHTYIFQNAQAGGEYIITMRWEYSIEEGSPELLCFGARLPIFAALSKYESTQAYIKGEKGIKPLSDEWYKSNDLYYTAINYGASDTDNSYSAPMHRFDTLDELNAFKTEFESIYIFDKTYQETPSFNAATAKYDKIFFENNSLFVIYLASTSGACRYSVESIINDGNNLVANVGLTRGPRTDDWQEWFLTLAISKEEIATCTSFDAQVFAKEVKADDDKLAVFSYSGGIVNASHESDLSAPIYRNALNSNHSGSLVTNYPIYKIESVAELEAFKSDYSYILSPKRGDDEMYFSNITYHCDEEFFKDTALLVAYVYMPYCDSEYKVSGITVDHTGFTMLIEKTKDGQLTAIGSKIAYVFIDKDRIKYCPAFHACLTNPNSKWDELLGTWEAPMTVMGLPSGTDTKNAVYQLTFKRDNTGFETAAGGVREFVYSTEDGILTITYNSNSSDDVFSQFSYKISGDMLTISDVRYPDRVADLKKADEPAAITEIPNSALSMSFFSGNNLPQKLTKISGFTFEFEQSGNYSVLTGTNKEYLDNARLDALETAEPVFSFSIYQDSLEYTAPLINILDSIITIDYEGKTYDIPADRIDKYIKIEINNVKAEVKEVRLGKGNGHVDYSFKFTTGYRYTPGDIIYFKFSVNEEKLYMDDPYPVILSSGNVSVTPTAKDGSTFDYSDFILKVGDRYKAFTGSCIAWGDWTNKLYIEDLTDDGTDDITVTFQNNHGTVAYGEEIHIFDGVTLEEYEVEKVYGTIGNYVNFSADEDMCYIEIGGKIHSIDKSSLYPDYEKKDWWDVPATSNIFNFSVENGVLKIKIPCQYTTSGFVGSIIADYAFENGKFVYKSAIVEE